MNVAYVVLFVSLAMIGGSAVLAFAWALRNGQFQNFKQGATSIFDPDEPIGKVTDRFPGMGERVEGAEEERR